MRRSLPDELDLTRVERAPGSRADIETVTVFDSAATPDPARRRAGTHHHAVTSLWMTLPLVGWLTVCVTTGAPALFTVATCGGVLLLTAGTLVLCRPAPTPRATDPQA